MRLDKLTVGSPKDSPTHQFKNLKNVTIDFDQDHWVTVMIGWNGTGKSNVLEGLAIIFRDLIDRATKPTFAYRLAYKIGREEEGRYIQIDADPDRDTEPYLFYVGSRLATKRVTAASEDPPVSDESDLPRGTEVKHSAFLADERNLPRYVFSYYSGDSRRMHDVLRPYLETYDGKLRKGQDPGLKRLFFALPAHSQFVLLAFLIQQNDFVRAFLDDHLGLASDEGVESVLFVLRKPPWKSKAPDGDPRFWNARGVVRDFLARLFEVALAPVRISRQVPVSLWNKKTIEFLYLYVKDIGTLRRLVGNQPPAEFFRDLESTYVSELIEELRIRVRLKTNDASVTFRELSEGEQQLLTVLGLLRFTGEHESLFLLDEPDTHLNPRWCVEYLTYLEMFVGTTPGSKETSHVVLATHNPLAIAELVREQVQVLQVKQEDAQRRIIARHPDLDPRGQGYAAIVTSDMFGIASSLDRPTQLLLEKQRVYAAKHTLTPAEQTALDDLNRQLDRLGFRFFHPDEEYSRYLRLRNSELEARFGEPDSEALAARAVAMTREEKEVLASELVEKLLAEDGESAEGPTR